MKKIIIVASFICLFMVSEQLFGALYEADDSCLAGALTAGYVFKNDCAFKEVYGHGVVNVITADGCYYRWNPWGIGAKVSYFRAHGKTTFLKFKTLLQELPVTVYVRRIKSFRNGLQVYGSLGGGYLWVKEKSYLGDTRINTGIGEIEVGFNYPVCCCVNLTTAFRYLFPPQCHCSEKVDVGGVDIRAGFEVSF